MSKFINPTKVVTGKCTFSYLNCWDPKSINGGTPKFSVSLMSQGGMEHIIRGLKLPMKKVTQS